MKLIIIRHGDPDYVTDTLTEQGKLEAAALADRMEWVEAAAYYASPLGRAQETAGYTLSRIGRTAETCDWLREFDQLIEKPNSLWNPSIPWDWMPADWTAREAFFDKEAWLHEPVMAAGKMEEGYRNVTEHFDWLLEKHGYVRDGYLYRAEKPNHDTLIFFCHFGLECVLLSHLLNISPMALWHGTCACTTGVTTVVTEERQAGVASWRMLEFGDVSHLRTAGLEPGFSGRFCECFTDDTRH